MKNLAFLFLLLIQISVFGQNEPKVVGYFDAYWRKVEDKNGASFYRTVETQPDGKFLVKDYYMSGQLQMQPVVCTAYEPKLIWEGITTLYHQNGKVSEEGFFKNEQRSGLHNFWYDNGAKQKTSWCDDDKEVKVHQYWTKEGVAQLTNGSGTVAIQSEYGDYFTDFQDSVQISSYHYDETLSDTIYLLVEQAPDYKGGMEQASKTVVSNIKYPKSARRLGIEGTVYVQFVVDEQGKSIAHSVMKGISIDCDNEALRVVKLLNNWKPGLVKGKPVKVKFVYPIRYRLE